MLLEAPVVDRIRSRKEDYVISDALTNSLWTFFSQLSPDGFGTDVLRSCSRGKVQLDSDVGEGDAGVRHRNLTQA